MHRYPMSNTYVWTITAMDCVPQVDGLMNYVVTSHWLCQGTDGEYTGSVANTAIFVIDPNKPDYIPYDQLTEAEVVAWTQSALGPDIIQTVYASINAQIETQENPNVIQPPLPWKTE
jgi:hypothetical protein